VLSAAEKADLADPFRPVFWAAVYVDQEIVRLEAMYLALQDTVLRLSPELRLKLTRHLDKRKRRRHASLTLKLTAK
jgi:hypothetical protein